MFPGMLTLLHSIVSVLACRFRGLTVLELGILGLRNHPYVSSSPAAESSPADRDSTACSGSGFTDYCHAVWTRRRWSSWPQSSSGIVRASTSFGAAVSRAGRPSADREIRDLFGQMNAANPLGSASDSWGALELRIDISQATVLASK